MANVKVFADRQTDRRTGKKLYAPDLSIRGIKILHGSVSHRKSLSYTGNYVRIEALSFTLTRYIGYVNVFADKH
jgi:hypothetical protein